MTTLGSLRGPVEESPVGTIPGGYVAENEGPVDR